MAEKVRVALQEVGMDVEASAPYLLQLLGVKEGTESLAAFIARSHQDADLWHLRQWSVKRSQRRPLIFEVEDLHWVDKTSEEYLVALVESLAGASILLPPSSRDIVHRGWTNPMPPTVVAQSGRADAVTVVRSTSQQPCRRIWSR